jgi:hypothetical protein
LIQSNPGSFIPNRDRRSRIVDSAWIKDEG